VHGITAAVPGCMAGDSAGGAAAFPQEEQRPLGVDALVLARESASGGLAAVLPRPLDRAHGVAFRDAVRCRSAGIGVASILILTSEG
jgi:hypothetical protein